MGKIAEPPKSVDEIDSPKHREIATSTVIVSVRPNADYPALMKFLELYGVVEEVSKPQKPINPEVEGYVVMRCYPSKVDSLISDYKRNGFHASSCIRGIDEVPESDEEWF